MFTLYAIVNYQTCGWCKKFRPVLESNVKAMNVKAQKHVEVVDLTTPEGKQKAQDLGFSGGIPCLQGFVDDHRVYNQPGYQDGDKFAQTLFTLLSTYA